MKIEPPIQGSALGSQRVALVPRVEATGVGYADLKQLPRQERQELSFSTDRENKIIPQICNALIHNS